MSNFAHYIYLNTGKKIDGISQWQALNHNLPSKRTEFVYAINEITGKSAIRYNVVNAVGSCGGHVAVHRG